MYKSYFVFPLGNWFGLIL